MFYFIIYGVNCMTIFCRSELPNKDKGNIAYEGFSFCLTLCKFNYSPRTEPNIIAGDKLLPGTNPGFLKSEENVKLHTFIYTKSVSENICVYNI